MFFFCSSCVLVACHARWPTAMSVDHDRHDRRRRRLHRRAPRRNTQCGIVELTALVPPYFSARAAKFRMFVERLFHKSGSAALMARSSLDPRAISWASMNFRNQRRTPLRDAVPKCAATPPQGQTPTEIALGSDQLSSQPPLEATRTGQAFWHLLGTCWRGRWCVATSDVRVGRPDLPRRSGDRKRSQSDYGAGKPLALPGFPDKGWQHCGCGWKSD